MNGCSDRALLSMLAERGPAEMAALADAFEIHPMTLDKRCDELQEKGHIRRVAGGVYVITEKGETHLETLSN